MLFGAAPFHPGLVSFGFHGLEDGVVAVKTIACHIRALELVIQPRVAQRIA